MPMYRFFTKGSRSHYTIVLLHRYIPRPVLHSAPWEATGSSEFHSHFAKCHHGVRLVGDYSTFLGVRWPSDMLEVLNPALDFPQPIKRSQALKIRTCQFIGDEEYCTTTF